MTEPDRSFVNIAVGCARLGWIAKDWEFDTTGQNHVSLVKLTECCDYPGSISHNVKNNISGLHSPSA